MASNDTTPHTRAGDVRIMSSAEVEHVRSASPDAGEWRLPDQSSAGVRCKRADCNSVRPCPTWECGHPLAPVSPQERARKDAERLRAVSQAGYDPLAGAQQARPVPLVEAPVLAPPPQSAASALSEAAKIVDGVRDTTHGPKERSFDAIARLWAAYLEARGSIDTKPLTGSDVALMMVLLKIGRVAQGTPARDHFVDMAGYAGVAYEVHTSL